MAKLSDAEIVKLVDSEFESSLGAPGGDISSERALAYDYYLSKPLGNEVEGQSSVVTSDVSDVVDGIMPSLLRLFTTADNLVGFDAVGPEDEEQAAQESDHVNYTFFKRIENAFIILYTWFFDALLQKNGIVKAWWDESEVITEETYEGLNEFELASLLEDEELAAVEKEERFTETVDPRTQQIVKATVYDVTFKRTSKSGRVNVINVPPEEYRISGDSRSVNPCDARMVGQERDITRSDLIAMGFDKSVVDDLPTVSESGNTNEGQSRKDKSDDTSNGDPDKSQEKVKVREAYVKIDMDGNGKSELYQVFASDGKFLGKEAIDRQPFHIISPQPLPHKHFGRATAEKVMDIMKVSTTLLRQSLDNLYRTNQPGHGVWEQAIGENTLDDLSTTQVGRIARFSRPMSEAYTPMTTPYTARESFSMLEYMDKMKRDRTGVNADSEGLSPEQLKNIQTGVLDRANDLSRMKIEAIARIFAETGIKSLFLHIHELLQKHQKKAEIVKLRNKWVQVDPQAWRNRRDMTVQIGLGIGSRENNLIHLNNIWLKQQEMVNGGGMNLTVSPMNMYNTASEMVKNANLKDPNMFFTNPGNQKAPPPSSEQEELQRQQQAIMERQQQLDMQDQALKQQRLDFEQEKAAAELDEKRQQREDDIFIELEKLQNQLTDMSLRYQTSVPGAAV